MAPRVQDNLRVTAIVPAYDEQATLTDVLSVLRSAQLIDEILVVSDGSTDETVRIALELGVKTLHFKDNHGKGIALATGVAHTTASILVFVDGDILNLSEYLLNKLIEPVLEGRCDMNIGIRNRGWAVNALHRRTGPLLSGIRCLRREIFLAVPEECLQGYAVETALNWACGHLALRRTTTVLFGLKHLVKEKKRGLPAGVRARLRMFVAVFLAHLRLRLMGPATPAPRRSRPEPELINF